MADRWAAFDCYGTLVDWDGGIRRELARIFGAERGESLLARYHELEPLVEREEPTAAYRLVMQRCLAQIADEEGVVLTDGDRDALGRSLPSWDVFPEVPDALQEARIRGWRLCILSNTDREFIEASRTAIGVPFEHAIVASEVGSYKPAPGHWEAFERLVGHPPDVHVGASMFHDVVPAGARGLPTVWINRTGVPNAAGTPSRELFDLTGLADALDTLASAR